MFKPRYIEFIERQGSEAAHNLNGVFTPTFLERMSSRVAWYVFKQFEAITEMGAPLELPGDIRISLALFTRDSEDGQDIICDHLCNPDPQALEAILVWLEKALAFFIREYLPLEAELTSGDWRAEIARIDNPAYRQVAASFLLAIISVRSHKEETRQADGSLKANVLQAWPGIWQTNAG